MSSASAKASEAKKAIRRKAISLRDAIAASERLAFDIAIAERLLALEEYSKAQSILFYAGFRSEVQTEHIIAETLKAGKTVLLPKVDGKGLTKHVINGIEELKPGHMGIPEPTGGRQMKVEDIDLLVIPGVAFDLTGTRIGYGGGYYDRLLPRVKGKKTIAALAFEAQILEGLPREAHDIPMDIIITERRVIRSAGGKH